MNSEHFDKSIRDKLNRFNENDPSDADISKVLHYVHLHKQKPVFPIKLKVTGIYLLTLISLMIFTYFMYSDTRDINKSNATNTDLVQNESISGLGVRADKSAIIGEKTENHESKVEKSVLLINGIASKQKQNTNKSKEKNITFNVKKSSNRIGKSIINKFASSGENIDAKVESAFPLANSLSIEKYDAINQSDGIIENEILIGDDIINRNEINKVNSIGQPGFSSDLHSKFEKHPFEKMEIPLTNLSVKPSVPVSQRWLFGLQSLAGDKLLGVGLIAQFNPLKNISIISGLMFQTEMGFDYDNEGEYMRHHNTDFLHKYGTQNAAGLPIRDIRIREVSLQMPIYLQYSYPVSSSIAVTASVGTSLQLLNRHAVNFDQLNATDILHQRIFKNFNDFSFKYIFIGAGASKSLGRFDFSLIPGLMLKNEEHHRDDKISPSLLLRVMYNI